jgi:hypothetical protein
MKNKAIIVILICAAATMAVISFYYLTPRALVGATASNGNAPSQSLQHSPLSAQVGSDHKPTEPANLTTADLETLKVIGNGLRSLKNKDVRARANLTESGTAAIFCCIHSTMEAMPRSINLRFATEE